MATSDNNTEPANSSTTDILLTEDDILAFFLSKSGEVKNSELVRHFRPALKTGLYRNTNRQQFPRFINRLATVTVDDNGKKTLTLKKKFQPEEAGSTDSDVDRGVETAAAFVEAEETASSENDNVDREEYTGSQAADGNITATTEVDMNGTENGEESRSKVEDSESTKLDNTTADETKDDEVTTSDKEPTGKSACSHGEETESVTEREKDILGGASSSDNGDVTLQLASDDGTEAGEELVDGGPNMVSLRRRKATDTTENKPPVKITIEDHSKSSDRQPAPEDDDWQSFYRVRELAKRIDDTAIKRVSTAAMWTQKQVRAETDRPPAERRRPALSHAPYDFTMNDAQREWTLKASSSDYQALAKLLNSSPELACRRDFITGYSALHWAAKNGRPDVVKLLMGSSQVPDVDARSHGGYTALHIAAINSRHDVIELLVVVYKADTDVADFSGRKPIYYLSQAEKSVPGQRSSALPRSEMFLTPRRGATTATPRNRLVVKRRQPSVADHDDSDNSDRPSTIQSLISLTTRPLTTLMLPPRDLPAVIRRRPVSVRQTSESHSDSETQPNASQSTGLRPTGSTSDIVGTLV